MLTRVTDVLGSVAAVLACPVCGASLAAAPAPPEQPRRLVCPTGHSYDVARQGYVSLLPGSHRHRGDTAAMVARRLAVLGAGHFDPVADAVLDLTAGTAAPGVLLDVGGGPGWYAARLLDAFPERAGISLDVSAAAARRAARAHPRLASVVADATAGYPLRTGSAAVVTCLFAPRQGTEISRVLAPGGVLVIATAGRDHLRELVATIGMLAVPADKEARLAKSLPGFGALDQRRVRGTVALSPAAATDLALMGPSGFHLDAERVAAGWAPGRPVEVTLDVLVRVYTVK